jgi:hypothetical protein
MNFLDLFKSPPKVIDLDAMTPDERIAFFKEQEKAQAKLLKQAKGFINAIVGAANLFLPEAAQPYISKLKPYIENFLVDPEKIADTMAETIEGICTKAGIPSHHLKICITKPKGYVNDAGEKVRNKDVWFELQVYNPHYQQWQAVKWDIRMQLRALKNKDVKYDVTGMIKDLYNAKPEIAAPNQEQLKLSE